MLFPPQKAAAKYQRASRHFFLGSNSGNQESGGANGYVQRTGPQRLWNT